MIVVNTRSGQTHRLDFAVEADAQAWAELAKTPEEITAVGVERGSSTVVVLRPKDFGTERPTFEVETSESPHVYQRVRMFVGELEVRATITGRRASQVATRVEVSRVGWRRHRRAE